MVLYDKAYAELKSKYLIPLTKYNVPYRQLRNTNVKKIIIEKMTSVDIINDKVIIVHLDNDYLFKALLGDIELFYIRNLIHKNDTKYCQGEGISANWNIVTSYYNAFFAASLMLRLCFRGNIFFDAESKKNLEKMVTLSTGTIVSLDSNQFYEVLDEQGRNIIRLTRSVDGTHELVWKKMDGLISEMILLSRDKSDELLILTALKQINNLLSSTYPSKLRNRVNYQPVYGLDYIEKKLYQVNDNISWAKFLVNYSNTKDDNQIACYMYAYSKYIEYFCSNFIAEYYEIKGKENGILKSINANRTQKIELESIKYIF